MDFENFSFGSIQIDGVVYEHDLVIDRGQIRKRKKSTPKAYRAFYGHTFLSIKEAIPWHCRRLVVGTGAQGALPIMDEVHKKAERRHVEFVSLPTAQAPRGPAPPGWTRHRSTLASSMLSPPVSKEWMSSVALGLTLARLGHRPDPGAPPRLLSAPAAEPRWPADEGRHWPPREGRRTTPEAVLSAE